MQLLAINSVALAETPTGSEQVSQPECEVVANGGDPQQNHLGSCLKLVKKGLGIVIFCDAQWNVLQDTK